METGAPDPWEGGEGTFSAAEAVISGVIDTLIDAITGFPDLLKRIAEWFGIVIGKVFEPIARLRDALAKLPGAVLAAMLALALLWVHGRAGK